MPERSPVETQLHQQTRHLIDASPETVAKVVAGEIVTPDRSRHLIDVVIVTDGRSDFV